MIDQNQIISARFIGHAKMCFSNPQDWPAPIVSFFTLSFDRTFFSLKYDVLIKIFLLRHCIMYI